MGGSATVGFGSSADILAQLNEETVKATARIEQRGQKLEEFQKTLDGLEEKFARDREAMSAQDAKIARRVLESTFDSLREEMKAEERDLAHAVFGLNAFMEKLGVDYKDLGQPTKNELARIQAAENDLKQAEVDLAGVGRVWLFKRARAQAAEAAVGTAKQRLAETRRRVNEMARERLMNACLEQTLDEFKIRVVKTIQIMEKRVQEISAQLAKVSSQKERAFQIKEQAAKSLEKFEQELNKHEGLLKEAEERLGHLTHGTEEYARQQKTISDLRAKTEEYRGKYNIALTLHESKEKFAQELEVHERTQTQLRDNQRMWITSLKSDTEEREVTFRSFLEARKAAADQEVAKTLDELGHKIDQEQTEMMAGIGAASERVRVDRAEKIPSRLKGIHAVRAAQAESDAVIRQREHKLIAYFKENYNIDPMDASFFTHMKEEQKEAQEAGVA